MTNYRESVAGSAELSAQFTYPQNLIGFHIAKSGESDLRRGRSSDRRSPGNVCDARLQWPRSVLLWRRTVRGAQGGPAAIHITFSLRLPDSLSSASSSIPLPRRISPIPLRLAWS